LHWLWRVAPGDAHAVREAGNREPRIALQSLREDDRRDDEEKPDMPVNPGGGGSRPPPLDFLGADSHLSRALA